MLTAMLDSSPASVVSLLSLAEAGDDDGLAAELVDLAAGSQLPAAVRDELQALPDARRCALTLRVIERAAATDPPTPVDGLLMPILDGLAPDALSWRAAHHLIDAVSTRTAAPPGSLAVLAAVAERETGECPPALLAVMRRTAHEGDKHWPARYRAPIQPWLERTHGRLNVGEPWAEAANAETPAPELLTHALAAAGAKPAARWARRAKTLLPELGADETRTLIRHWLSLVPRPRTITLRPDGERWDPNEVPDAYNAKALRGLLYLLAVTPPQGDDIPAVGRLAQHAAEKIPGYGPRSQMIAYASVYALERFSTVASLRELSRLRSLGQPPGIAASLTTAINRRAVALNVDPSRL
ncbi:hypothetical protein GCM10018962_71540 [Dactylosporangium matsuzakiense]|uniref:Uncharacterized protein n=2 Tax=Dactylosporangium matsuzakiense TaxID=53360 RepID=A0A9W6KMU1_9ACTN|nr:hypothetical protein GCM10017581_048990 [Dactylosporangium matsuzakiense]